LRRSGTGMVAPPATHTRRPQQCRPLPRTRRQISGQEVRLHPRRGPAAGARVADLLAMLVTRLKAQQQAGSRYYIGDSLTAVDVYSATFTAMFDPLPPEQCKMDASTRAAFSMRDAQVDAAIDPILFAHRDMIYAQHLELPL